MNNYLASAASAVALIAVPVSAQQVATPLPAAAPAIAAATTTNAVLRAGTPVSLRIMEEITTKEKKARVGQRFRMEVASALEVNGAVVLPAGTPVEAEITSVRNKGMWGKSGHLGARPLYARVNGRQIRLTGNFDDKGVTGTAAVVGALVAIPLAGFFVTGTSAVLPMGGEVPAFIDEDVELSIAAARPGPMQVAAPAAMTVQAEAEATAEASANTRPPAEMRIGGE